MAQEYKYAGFLFTLREVQIINEVIKGDNNNVVAHKLGVKPKTVKYHLTRIYKKMDIKNRAELIIKVHNFFNAQAGVPIVEITESESYGLDKTYMSNFNAKKTQ
jgi:DNA-binding CsgD family transcriptional regulator